MSCAHAGISSATFRCCAAPVWRAARLNLQASAAALLTRGCECARLRAVNDCAPPGAGAAYTRRAAGTRIPPARAVSKFRAGPLTACACRVRRVEARRVRRGFTQHSREARPRSGFRRSESIRTVWPRAKLLAIFRAWPMAGRHSRRLLARCSGAREIWNSRARPALCATARSLHVAYVKGRIAWRRCQAAKPNAAATEFAAGSSKVRGGVVLPVLPRPADPRFARSATGWTLTRTAPRGRDGISVCAARWSLRGWHGWSGCCTAKGRASRGCFDPRRVLQLLVDLAWHPRPLLACVRCDGSRIAWGGATPTDAEIAPSCIATRSAGSPRCGGGRRTPRPRLASKRCFSPSDDLRDRRRAGVASTRIEPSRTVSPRFGARFGRGRVGRAVRAAGCRPLCSADRDGGETLIGRAGAPVSLVLRRAATPLIDNARVALEGGVKPSARNVPGAYPSIAGRKITRPGVEPVGVRLLAGEPSPRRGSPCRCQSDSRWPGRSALAVRINAGVASRQAT